jgi:hypothetical protein
MADGQVVPLILVWQTTANVSGKMRKRDLALSLFEAAVAILVGAQGPLSPSFTYPRGRSLADPYE